MNGDEEEAGVGLESAPLIENLKAGHPIEAPNDQRSIAVDSCASQISNASSILSKMQRRVVSFNRTNGSSLKVGVMPTDHDFVTHEQYNDLTQARRRRFDFVQSNVIGPAHLKNAVMHEMVRVLADGRRLNELKGAVHGEGTSPAQAAPMNLDHPLYLSHFLNNRVIPSH